MKFLPLLPGLLLVSPAAAQGTNPHTVLTLHGACQALAAGSESLTDICADEIMQVIYTDRRMELAIWTDSPSGRFLVFSGPATEDEAGLGQQVDLVIDGKDGSGNNNVELAATGQCTLDGDPFDGAVQFTCEATDEAGKAYSFAFLTDGGEPENMLD